MSSPVLLAPLRAEVAAARFGARAHSGVRVERTGMGPSRASSSADRLLGLLSPEAPVAVVGFAGGLDRSDRAGDLIVATELATSDGSLPARLLDNGLAQRIRERLARVLGRVRSGPVVCSPSLMGKQDVAEMLEAAGSKRPVACEMESAWLATLAEGRPFVVVRALVDRPGRPALGPWTLWGGAVAWRRLALAAGLVAEELEQD